MSVIFGFGCKEEEQRHEIMVLLIASAMRGENLFDVNTKWNADKDQYDKLPKEKAPERYTQFYLTNEGLCFHHINRRYPFSPDGWAMLEVRIPFPSVSGGQMIPA
jgi:hypothetical protein